MCPIDKNDESEKVLDDASFSGDIDSSVSESVEDYTDEVSSSYDFSYIDEKDLENNEENKETVEDEFKKEKIGFPTWLKVFLIILMFGILVLVVALFLKNKIRPIPNENKAESCKNGDDYPILKR